MLWWILIGYLALISTLATGLLMMVFQTVLQARRSKSAGLSAGAEALVADSGPQEP
ncbi:hypothetical protein [Rhizobium grahamii]|uniref:hypothetical protein n=1 Tax=Rhizobium grahamii TaxID=1120045 RepID=UPI00031060EC|nr:hypothetical protein [Rhizobium grahamii]